jgi:hypothetical protein
VGLAAIQYFERVKDSAGLSPKHRFIAAEPIKGEVGKVGETQKQRANSTAVDATSLRGTKRCIFSHLLINQR